MLKYILPLVLLVGGCKAAQKEVGEVVKICKSGTYVLKFKDRYETYHSSDVMVTTGKISSNVDPLKVCE